LIRADWSPCLCDVGLANFLPENLFRWAAPHSSWLAPEIVQLGAGGQRAQAVPGAALSFAADIFALGGVLCEIFYCVKPWEHPNGAVSHTFAAAEGADFMDVQCAAPSVPPSLPYPRIAHVMERCWATSPINRPTMQEIVACLQSLCATLGGDTALQTALQRQERGTAMSEPPSITCSSSSLVSEDEEAGGRLLMYASPS
jgi:serine/threonine protein kinase